jgi:hypothetical protein
MSVSVEGQTMRAGQGQSSPAPRQPLSRVRLADDAAGYRRAAQVYGELANNARCLSRSGDPSMKKHHERSQRHWLRWQAMCLRAANIHDQRSEAAQ